MITKSSDRQLTALGMDSATIVVHAIDVIPSAEHTEHSTEGNCICDAHVIQFSRATECGIYYEWERITHCPLFEKLNDYEGEWLTVVRGDTTGVDFKRTMSDPCFSMRANNKIMKLATSVDIASKVSKEELERLQDLFCEFDQELYWSNKDSEWVEYICGRVKNRR